MTYISEFRMRVRKSEYATPNGGMQMSMHVEIMVDNREILGDRMLMSAEPDESEIDMYFRRAAVALKHAVRQHREQPPEGVTQ